MVHSGMYGGHRPWRVPSRPSAYEQHPHKTTTKTDRQLRGSTPPCAEVRFQCFIVHGLRTVLVEAGQPQRKLMLRTANRLLVGRSTSLVRRSDTLSAVNTRRQHETVGGCDGGHHSSGSQAELCNPLVDCGDGVAESVVVGSMSSGLPAGGLLSLLWVCHHAFYFSSTHLDYHDNHGASI